MVLCEADILALSEVVFFAPLGISSILNDFYFSTENSAFPVLEYRCVYRREKMKYWRENVCSCDHGFVNVCVCVLFLALKQRYRLVQVVRNMGVVITSEVL